MAIWCDTCVHEGLDPYDPICMGCRGGTIDTAPSSYMKVEPTQTVEDTAPTAVSMVDHPSHYQSENGMECIEEMILVFGKEAVKNFCLCNVWKYRYRASEKNGQEDMDKAHWYMKKFKELCDIEEARQCIIDI